MRFDVVVIGGGAAGCALAARLSRDDRLTVGLLEAGPDHGRYDTGAWPPEMLDAMAVPTSHDWDQQAPSCCSRAKVIGGSSAHNGCWAVLGASADHDAWAPFSHGSWTHEAIKSHVDDAMRTLRVRPFAFEDRTPWHEAVITTAVSLGLSELADINDGAEGVGWVPLNAVGRTRWHAAFAYLDPARDRPNLQVLGDTLAVRLEFTGSRATGVRVVRAGREELIGADYVVLCAGSYGNPPLLVRSGVGPEKLLRDLGSPILYPLDGVGQNLIDHGGMGVLATAWPGLTADPQDYVTQTLIKARSGFASDHNWDLHLVPWSETDRAGTHVYVMDPVSRGSVRTVSLDPTALPVIEHGFFTDPDGLDRRKLLDGLELARQLLKSGLAEILPDQPTEFSGYWHPVGTCAMGSVVDELGKLHGVDNVHIADASVMPVIPRANTHVLTVAVANRLGELLAKELDSK